MSVISYTAKRSIEPSGFSATGTDISADATDDSFNSVSTALNGVADDEWVKIGGFANAANNGWFQANGASTATRISQDTSTTLVTEVAGPNVSIVGYRRGIDQSYSIEFDVQQLTRSGRLTRQQNESLGGTKETLLHRQGIFWRFTLTPLLKSALPQWREFIHSVAAGESFTFDPYGYIASPDDPVTCDLVSESYSEDRLDSSQYFSISFEVQELS